ncbi:MAG: HAMP domain-containing histidine kinase [Epsilonproteobacteria bacterium]|nr:HAMP domain-containing histidine kinase [Campylobacterota bacterium]
MKSRDFKFDLTFAFIMFAFLIVVIITYAAIYIFTNLITAEFKEKVKFSANNVYYIYSQKKKNIQNSAISLAKNELFNTKFHVNSQVIKSVFNAILVSNGNLKAIKFYNRYGKLDVGCEKIGKDVYCNLGSISLNIKSFDLKGEYFEREKIEGSKIKIKIIAPVKLRSGFLEVDGIIDDLILNKEYYDVIFIGNKGEIYYSNFLKAKSIYDIFNHFIADKIIKKEGFISDDIYVKRFSKNLKVLFIQNKKVLSKTKMLTQKLMAVILFLAVVIAIPLGLFFSKPLYNFYEELDKRVKEEIEKRRQKEQLLMHQSKLAALGEMLGNIAHQWRHPITRLSLLIQNLEIAFKMGKLNQERFDKFKDQAFLQINYMSDTIDDFINFFKKDTKKVDFYPQEIISDVLKLLEGRLKQNKVDVEVDIKDNFKITGYKSEFSQVVLNIVNNAIDVLNERNIQNRKIKIRVSNKKIEIEDNAGGVDEKIINKIFEPYFTTKFQSQGTGIGLYMSRVIITQHFNGEIYVKNSENGAIFVIEL